MTPYQAHVISNTHWDREWRYPFQTYRMDLVEAMDRLLELLEHRPDYRAFLLDSQTVILEDYLEIRPEKLDQVRKHAAAGRIEAGPWYTLPDEWGCPGEALVRNLLMGHRTAKEYGPVFKVGYTPFSNGQISQMPQIYREFGLDSIFFYRGISRADAKSEYQWEGPDGSWIYGFRFGIYARYNYYYLVYRPGLLDRQLADREYSWNPAELPYHVASEQSQDRQYGWMNLELKVRPENLKEALGQCLKHTAQDATTSQLLYMMGHDHSFPDEMEVQLIKALQEAADPGEQEVIHGSLVDYMEKFRAEEKNLEVLRGEMRHVLKDGLWTTLMANILSCRLYLKQRNAAVNAQLLLQTEPLAACAWMTGSDYPRRYLELAWKDILKNQAHDAIGGCSVDSVHTEMLTRWNSVEQICDGISRRAMTELVRRIDGRSVGGTDLQLTVFNTLPFYRDELAESIIDLPNAKAGEAYSLETTDGKPVAFQELSREEYTATVESGIELSMTLPLQRCRVAVELRDLPGMGHDVVVVRREKKPPVGETDLKITETFIENEFLKIEITQDNSITLTDKRTGLVMRNLGVLEDTAEFGDPWNRVQPEGDRSLLSTGVPGRVTLLENGPLRATLRVEYEFPVPAGKAGDVRSDDLVTLPVTMDVSLVAGAETAEVKLALDNRAKDHRLRVLLPSGIADATHSTADGQFDVLKREIALPDSTRWREQPFATHPMWNWVDVSDGQNGFGVISDGLIEYEVVDNPERTIAITLLRAFGKFVYERPTPDAQCPGEHTYRFVLCPHEGDWRRAGFMRRAMRLMSPVQAVLSAPTVGERSTRRSFLAIDPEEVVFSGIKESEDGEMAVLRFWNSSVESQDVTISLDTPVREAWLLTMEEKIVEKLTLGGDGWNIRLAAGAKKIVTLGLRF